MYGGCIYPHNTQQKTFRNLCLLTFQRQLGQYLGQYLGGCLSDGQRIVWFKVRNFFITRVSLCVGFLRYEILEKRQDLYQEADYLIRYDDKVRFNLKV
jgi:hypothetical protein